MARAITNQGIRQLVEEEEFEHQDDSRPYRSFVAGLKGLQASGSNALAAGLRAVGVDDTARGFERSADEASARAAGIRGAVPSFTDAQSAGDVGTAAIDAVAGNAPLMGAQLAGAGTGFALGGPPGAFIGGMLPLLASTVGETSQNIRHDPDATGTPGEQARASLLSGAVQAAIGAAVPAGGVAKIFGGGATPGVGKTLASTALGEGATEVGEQAVQRGTHKLFNTDVNMFDADARNDYINSFLAGGLVGTAFGGVKLGGRKLLDMARERAAQAEVDEDRSDPTFGDNSHLQRMLQVEELLRTGEHDEATLSAARDFLAQTMAQLQDPVKKQRGLEVLKRLADREAEEGIEDSTVLYEQARAELDVEDEANVPEGEASAADALLGDPFTPGGTQYLNDAQTERPYVVARGGISPEQLSRYNAWDSTHTYTPVSALEAARGQNEKPAVAAERILNSRPQQYQPFYDEDVQAYEAEYAAADAQIEALEFERATLLDTAPKSADLKAVERQIGRARNALRAIPKPEERFLTRFQMLKRTPKSKDVSGPAEMEAAITHRDVVQSERGKKAANPIMRFGKDARFPDQNREFPIQTANGQAWVDAPNLASAMLKKMTAAGMLPREAPTNLRAALAFLGGIMSLAENPAISAETLNAVPDDVVMWKGAKGAAPLTFGDFKRLRADYANHIGNIQALQQQYAAARQEYYQYPPGDPARDAVRARGKRLAGSIQVQEQALEKAIKDKQRQRSRTPTEIKEAAANIGDRIAERDDKLLQLQLLAEAQARKERIPKGKMKQLGEEIRELNGLIADASAYARSGLEDTVQEQSWVEEADSSPADDGRVEARPLQPLGPRRAGLFEGLHDEAEMRLTAGEHLSEDVRDLTPQRDPIRGLPGTVAEPQRREEIDDEPVQRRTEGGLEAAQQAEEEVPTEAEIKVEEAPATDEEIKAFEEIARRDALHQNLAGMLKGMAKLVGVEFNGMLTMSEAIALKPDREFEIRMGAINGFYHSETRKIFVNPVLKDRHAVAVAMHEFGHAVERQAYRNANSRTKEAINAEFEAWRAEQERVGKVAHVNLTRRPSAIILERALASDARDLNDLDPGTREYALMFKEWFADNVARWAESDAEPQTLVDQFFAHIAETLRRMVQQVKKMFREDQLGEYAPAASVAAFMQERVNLERRASHSESITEEEFIEAAPPPLEEENIEAAPPPPPEPPPPGGEHGSGDEYGPPPGDGLVGLLQSWKRAFDTGQATIIQPEVVRAIRDHMGDVLDQGDIDKLMTAATGPMLTQMRRALGASPAVAGSLEHDPELAGAYLYALTRLGMVEPGPGTREVVDRFEKLGTKMYAEIFGDMPEEQATNMVLQAIADGRTDVGERASYVELPSEVRDARRRRIARQWRDRVQDTMFEWYSKMMDTPHVRLLKTNNPFLRQIANRIGTVAGHQRGQRETMIEGKARRFSEFSQAYADALGDRLKDAAYKDQLLDVLYHPDKFATADPEIREGVQKLRELMNELYTYTKKAGIEFGKRSDYFPWVWNKEKLSAEHAAFLEFVKRDEFRQDWQAMMALWKEKGRVPQEMGLDEFIEQRIASLHNPDGVQGGQTQDENHNPGFRFMNPRDLNFLYQKADAEGRDFLASFFNNDLDATMLSYINSATKRAEYSRQLGANGERLTEFLNKARERGATDEEIQLAHDYVDAATGTYGVQTRRLLEQVMSAEDVPPAVKKFFAGEGQGVISPQLLNTMGWMITYQNYRILGLSVFNSFVDPLALGVRTGDLGLMGRAMKRSMQSLWKATNGETDRLMALVRGLGTMERAMVAEEIAAEHYGGHQFTKTQRKLNDALFKYNGVEALTQFTRMVSTAGGEMFLAKHGPLMGQNEESTRWMEELGLFDGDVQVVDGELKLLSPAERRNANDADLARDDRVRAAMRRFVDTTNVRPDASKRPLWLSDAHFLLVGHLKSFAFAFHETVLKRVGNEMKEGNMKPALILVATFMPMMLFADWLRDMIQYGPEGAPWKANWTILEHANYTAKRAGLYGREEIVDDIMEPLFEGDVPKAVTEALGPTASQIRQIFKYGVSERELPLQNVYRHWG